MKDERWIEDLRVRMADYEEPVPEGLWERIETVLMEKQKVRPATSVPCLWIGWRYVASVAAVLLLAFWIGMNDFVSKRKPFDGHVSLTEKLFSDTSFIRQNVLASISDSVPVVTGTKSKRKLAIHSDVYRSSVFPDELPDNSLGVPIPDTVSERRSSNTHPSGKRKKAYLPFNTTKSAHKKRTNNFTVNLYASNLPRISENSNGYGGFVVGYNSVADIMDGGMPDAENPLCEMLRYNLDKDIQTQVKHHQPVKIGFSFSYGLSNRMAIRSGLTYSRLVSTATSGSDEYSFETNQELHYIGIPVSLSYALVQNRQLSLYLLAGGATEKCISGSLNTDYIHNGNVVANERDNVCPKWLQWSVNVGAGIQYNLFRQIALYAEPGVNYYFNNRQSLETFYTQKPLKFNMEFGLRFSVR